MHIRDALSSYVLITMEDLTQESLRDSGVMNSTSKSKIIYPTSKKGNDNTEVEESIINVSPKSVFFP